MCGRYAHFFSWSQLHSYLIALGLPLDSYLATADGPDPFYNVAPTRGIPVLRNEGTLVSGVYMRWGLIPSWSKEPTSKYATFNARSEDAASKPTYREPFKRRRCLIPVSGFYEWKKQGKAKQPFYIYRADGSPLFFAGLWDRWGDELESATILTTGPNAEMREIHTRMPCILEPEQFARWLDPRLQDAEAVASMLDPAADGILSMHKVSSRVNDARNEGSDLIENI